jgi:hypothetical protein
MHAVIREATCASGSPMHESPQFKEFQVLHARQPGYEGTFVIDAGDGRMFTVTLWHTAQHAVAARVVLEPLVRRVLNPLMIAPSRLLGVGPVVVKDVVEAITQPV